MKINLQKINKTDLKVFDQFSLNALNKMKIGETIQIDYKKISKRSIDQNNFIWKCADIVAHNIDNPNIKTKEHALFQACIIAKHIDLEKSMFIENKKTGHSYWNFVRKSIAFDNMDQDEANELFNKLIEIFANMLNISISDLESEATASNIINTFRGEVIK